MKYKLDSTVLLAIDNAREISEYINIYFIPKEIFFAVIYTMPETPIYNYLISKGIKDEEIQDKCAKLLCEITNKTSEYSITTFLNAGNEVWIDRDIVEIIAKADKIAKKQYNRSIIEISHIIAAISELFPKEFMRSMSAFIPSLGMSNSLTELNYLESDNMLGFELPRELSSFLTVLNNKYSKDSKECHICGRDEETKALIRILMKKTKRNAVLIGEAGVGKTALVEKFTWMIVTGKCPKQFRDNIILSLDVNAIIAGTQYRGTAEQRFYDLIAFLEENPKCILFIDEIHLLLGAGACRDGDLDLANALKPILARGETQVIGATTTREYEEYFSKDSALKRRFEKITVNEPRIYEVYDMIKNQIKLLEEAHRTTISRELVDSVIFKASCFNFETRNPDRTLDLLDKTMVCAELEGRTVVTEQDILENFNINQNKFDKMPLESKTSTAYHEAGHYIAYRFSKELTEYVMLAVSIMPAEDYLGINVFEIDQDVTPSKNKDYYIELIGSFLAGRIAEKMYSHKLTAGASSDLTKATRIAKDVITRYGLDENFTQDRVFLQDSKNPMYNEQLISNLNNRIDKLLKEARKHTEELLTEKREYLDVLATALIKKGMLSNKEIDELFKEKLSN